MKVVNETFKEVATMVNEQGELVDKIEENTASALNSTEQGVNELKVYIFYYYFNIRKLIIFKKKLQVV